MENLRSVIASLKLSTFLKIKGWGFFGRHRARNTVLGRTRKVTAASHIQLEESSLLDHELLQPRAIKPSPDSRNEKLKFKRLKVMKTSPHTQESSG